MGEGLTAGRVNRGVAWGGLASGAVGALDVVATAILLRFFVAKEQYGVAALATMLFTALDMATDLGLSSAVIQRDDHSPAKLSTVFWLNVATSLVLAGLLALLGPVYAAWQGQPIVAGMLAAYGGKLVLQNGYYMPAAMMRRELRFGELATIRIVANVAEFAAKIGFAAAGLPIWCFVLGPLARTLATLVGVQLRHPWRPSLLFRPREAAGYAAFGLKTSATQILYHLYTYADYPVVNLCFGPAALGLYRAAYELVLEPVRVIATVITDVAFPTFARLRVRPAELGDRLIAFTRQNLAVVVPFSAVVFVAADDALAVAWGPTYAAAAPAARILCWVAVLRSVSTMIPPLLDGVGRPALSLLYTSVAAVVLPALFVIAGRVGRDYTAVAWAWAAGYPVAFAVLAFIAVRVIDLPPATYVRRVVGIPLCAVPALLAGAGARALAPGWSAGPRLLVVAAATIGVMGALLARFQGISPRAIARALRG
jgi:O-antigen/teichoic acid export membrane protein